MTKIKTGILKYLVDVVWKVPARDHSHANPADWIDEPACNGRIRTLCRVCGGFVGYRPVVIKRSKRREQ